MKKLLIVMLLLLTGCDRYEPSVSGTKIPALADSGLNDCTRFEVIPKTTYADRPEIVYRCPNSTTTTITEIPSGKTSYKQSIVLIDGKEYQPVK